MKKFYENGLQFHCTQCSYCCKGSSGYVFLSQKDLERLSKHLHLSSEDFLSKHTRLVSYNQKLRLSLLEKSENSQMQCEFWMDGCSVYEARPTQCRTYPFWPSILNSEFDWQKEAKECPGINHEKTTYSNLEINTLLQLEQENVPIEIDP